VRKRSTRSFTCFVSHLSLSSDVVAVVFLSEHVSFSKV